MNIKVFLLQSQMIKMLVTSDKIRFNFNFLLKDGFGLFCPCGKVYAFKCQKCQQQGYCSIGCQIGDVIDHEMFCKKIESKNYQSFAAETLPKSAGILHNNPRL